MTPPPARSPRRTAEAGLTPAAVSRLAGELRLACMRISRRVRFESTDAIAPHQFSVLNRLEKAPCTPGELAEIERVSPPSMTRTVGRLVELGLVERTADPSDRRQVILSLTPDAVALLRDIRLKRDAWMSVRVGRLTPAEQVVLEQAAVILTRVANE
ncbi:MarR family transcriptional regulator [Pedococcus sp. KACC 23699]|uniref:MarR family transcriptional regulator n=1 Tax=Pedococcus sp. KACC 23699 TaxID=3149228 RepID=A0AAU7JX98_9MICO